MGCGDGRVRANSAGAFIRRELGVIQPGWHESRIWQRGSDGAYLGCSDGGVRLALCEQTLQGHSDWVRSASFSPEYPNPPLGKERDLR